MSKTTRQPIGTSLLFATVASCTPRGADVPARAEPSSAPGATEAMVPLVQLSAQRGSIGFAEISETVGEALRLPLREAVRKASWTCRDVPPSRARTHVDVTLRAASDAVTVSFGESAGILERCYAQSLQASMAMRGAAIDAVEVVRLRLHLQIPVPASELKVTQTDEF